MSKSKQRVAARIIVYGSILLGLIVAANPTELGIPLIAFRWLLILSAFLTIAANKLPDVLPGEKNPS